MKITEQGNKITFDPGEKVNPRKGVPVDYTRSEITEFSRRSKNRLWENLNSMQDMAWMGTATFHDSAFRGLYSQQAKLDHATASKKRLCKKLVKMCFNGTVKTEYKIRKSGILKGHAIPHLHMILDRVPTEQELKILNLFWAGTQGSRLKRYEVKDAYLFTGDPIESREQAIEYICKDLCPKAMERLNGAKIGRVWVNFGDIKRIDPEDTDMDGKHSKFFQVKRTVRRYAMAMKRRYGKKSKHLSKALMVCLKSALRTCSVRMPANDFNRILAHCMAT